MTKLSTLTASTALSRTVPASLAGGATLPVTARKILAVNEQIAGSTFNIPYTAESDYVQENAATGTDAAGGAFTLANSAGAAIDANTRLLIHADGANGSTEIVDERGITLFGTGCAYFDGTSYWKVPGSYKMAFGTTQDFTVELWARGIGNGVNTQRLISVADAASSVESFFISWNGSNLFSTLVNGGAWTSIGSCSPDIWYHIAVVRRSGVYYTYLNGVAGMTSSAGSSLGAQSITIGAARDGTNPFSGWQDQIRISKVARYTGAFTPPTGAFTTDPDTVYLFQFDDGHGSQFIRDASASGHEVSLGAGFLSSVQTKFGSTSMVPPGGSSAAFAARSKKHSDFMLGADNFTLDAWVYASSLASSQTLVDFGSYALRVSFDTASGQFKIYLSSNGSSYDLANGTAFGALAAMTWTHVAVSRSGSSVYCFVGGVLGATVSVGSSAIATGTSYGLVLGNDLNVSNTPWGGYIDEVRVKRGQAVWTSNFTPPSSPYTTDDYTVLLLHFEGANGDKVTLDSSESSYGNNGFGDATTPWLQFRSGAALSSAQSRGGNSTYVALNGVDQYLNMTYATPGAGHPLYFATWEQVCIEGWFYWANTGNNGCLYAINDSSDTAAYRHYLLLNSGTPTLQIGGSVVATGPAFTAIGWHHFAVVRDGRGWCVYSDGIAGTIVSPQINPAYHASNTCTLCLGTYTATSNWLNGGYDSIRVTHGKPRYTANFTPGNLTQDADTALLWVFNGASGQKRVKELSKNTALIPATGARTVRDGCWLTPRGALTCSSIRSKFGTASMLSTTSTSASVYMDNASLISTLGQGGTGKTIESWVYIADYSATRCLFFIGSADGSVTYMRLQIQATTGYLFGEVAESSSSSMTATSSTAVPKNQWVHVAVYFGPGGDGTYLLINGTNVGSTSGTYSNYTTGSTRISIGARADGTSPFNGYIDEFRLSIGGRSFSPLPTLPYGQQYATGPFWVATKPGTSSLDLSAFSSIDNAAFTGAEPATTTLRFLISTDAYATALKVWNGSAWVSSGYAMSWNAGAGTLTTGATAAQLNAAGNSWTQLAAGLVALDVSDIASLNIVAVLATANQTYTPVLDAITLTMDEYVEMTPGSDYTVRFKDTAPVAQPMTVTRTKPGTGNVSVTYLP